MMRETQGREKRPFLSHVRVTVLTHSKLYPRKFINAESVNFKFDVGGERLEKGWHSSRARTWWAVLFAGVGCSERPPGLISVAALTSSSCSKKELQVSDPSIVADAAPLKENCMRGIGSGDAADCLTSFLEGTFTASLASMMAESGTAVVKAGSGMLDVAWRLMMLKLTFVADRTSQKLPSKRD